VKNLFTFFILSLLALATTTNCARKGSPTGGPKDTLSPVMVTANPAYESTNFKAKKIKLNFDEYIKFKDLNKQLIVSPPLKHQSVITPVGTASKKIEIEIIDTLKENTTYSFNFGNSIVDNNEGNELGSFKYVFSTGDYVDSLEIYGSASDAFEMETEKEISILLYEIDENYTDSIIYKEKPMYLTNTLDTIIFDITNIKSGTYQLIALKDYNNNYIYDPNDDKIGFADTPIEIPTDSVFTLQLFNEIPTFKLKRPLEKRMGKVIFGYRGKKENLSIELLTETPKGFKSFVNKEKDKDTLNFWFSPFETDSLQFRVQRDTLDKLYTVMLRTKKRDSLSLEAPISGNINPKDTFYLESNVPMEAIDPSKIYISDQDTLAVDFKTILNPSKTKLAIDFDRVRNGKYQIDMLPEAIVGFFGKSNDTLQYILRTKDIEDFGIFELQLNNPSNKHLIVDLITEKGALETQRFTSESTAFSFEDLQPKTYFVRIIFDENNNKKWDTGNFLKKIQPEKVYYYPVEIKLKANWTINEVIDVSSL